MKKAWVALTVLFLLLTGAVHASAVELKAGRIRSFGDNILTVTSEDGGLLTIEAFSGTVPLENPVTDLQIEGGTVEIHWQGLTFGGEPLMPGNLTLRATLTGTDRTVEQTEIRTKIDSPVPAVLCCLPVAQAFCANGKSSLKIEVALSACGTVELSAAPKDDPETVVWHSKTTHNQKFPLVVSWDGKGKNHKFCPPGEYVISAWSKACPEQICRAEITLLENPLPEPELTVTGSLMPADFSDDAAVWAALTSPVAVGNGPEGQGLAIANARTNGAGRAGNVVCRTVGLAILEIYDDGWVKVGAWRQQGGEYTEGYVKAEKLRMIRPNAKYGAVVDKKAQTITVYENGKKLGTALVSTGWTTDESRHADTHSGVYLLGTRLADFQDYGHTYRYPIRIECLNLIHSAGYAMRDGERDYGEETALLGSKASHGCIRVDPRTTEENGGINAWWIWTHMGHDAKIIVTPEE